MAGVAHLLYPKIRHGRGNWHSLAPLYALLSCPAQFVRHALLPVTEAAGKVRVVDLPVFARQLMPVSTHARSASSKSPHQSVPSSSPQYTPTSKSPNHLLQSQSQHAQQSSTMKLDATAMPHTKAAMGISRLGTATLQKKVRTHACNDGGSDDSNTCLKQWMAHKSSLGLSHTTTGPATVGALCKAHQGVNSGAGCHGYIFLSHRYVWQKHMC